MNIRFYNAKILVPGEGHDFQIVEGELWVKGTEILYIGDGNDVSGVCRGDEILIWDRELDVKGNLLMPGFKDAHTHSAMTFLRSFADDLPLQKWLNELVFPREAQLTPEDVYPLNILGIMEYLTSGITSNFDMYFFPEVNARASVFCGFRTVLTSAMSNFQSSVEEMEKDYYYVNELSELTSYLPGFHAEYTTSMERMKDLAKLSQKLKAPVWTHNSETELEVTECKKRWGKTPTQIMDEIGMYEYGGGGYHCVWFDEKDMDIFQKHHMSVVTNPASNLKLASGIAPIQAFVDRGINVAIGTDGPVSNNCLDMFREMFLTSGLAKIREKDAECVSAEEILYMATAGGAKAMGLDDCDCLAVGKKADMIMIDLNQPNMQPENNLVKNLVYSGSKQNVKMTMVNGAILYENQKFMIGVEPQDIYKQANAIIRRMK